MSKEGKKCVIYIRVSTEMQVDGYSLDAQRTVLQRYAEREGMIVKDIYEDAGKSGKSIEGRPSFSKLLADIRDGLSIDYILVYKLSRFGRNAADILTSIEYIQSYDINLIATEEGIDSSQTSGKLLISVLSAVSEIERENILEQTMNGRKEKARQGEWNGGFAPYGYKLENGFLSIAEDEANTIREIFNLFVNQHKGAYEIASILNIDGEGKKIRQNGTLNYWSSGTIKGILDNPVYKGKISFGRRKRVKVKGTKNQFTLIKSDDFLESEGKHDAIISEELWNQAHELRMKNKRDRGGNPFAAKHVLAGLLRCPCCGGPLFVKYTKKKKDGDIDFFEYGCYNVRTDRGHSCTDYRRIVGYDIESYIVNLVKNLLNSNELANLIISKVSSPVDTSKFEKRINLLKDKLDDAYKNRDNLEEDIDSLSSKDVNYEQTRKRYNERLNKLYSTISYLEDEMSDLTLKLAGIKSKDITIEKVEKCLKRFDLLYDCMTQEEQRELLGLLIREINFKEDGSLKNIIFKFPVSMNDDPRSNDQSKYLDVEYAISDTTIFLKEHELQIIQNGSSRPVHRLVRSHIYNRVQPTYKQIKDYVLANYNLKVSTEYIAYVKRLHGIAMQNIRLQDDAKHHIPPKEKIISIENALKYYKMI